ncbi:ribonuclease H-like domain-containing protein [Tanacetum coccineum]
MNFKEKSCIVEELMLLFVSFGKGWSPLRISPPSFVNSYLITISKPYLLLFLVIVSKHPPQCGLQQKIMLLDEDDMVVSMHDVMVGLRSVKSSYFKSSGILCYQVLLTRDPLPSVKTAFAVISGEESHRNISSTRTTKPAATAFVAKTFDNNKKSNNASADLHSNGVSSNNATTSNSPVFLSNVSNLGLTVGHPNGTQALITKIGDLKINNEVTLYDVLVDLKENRTVGIGKQYNGLYLFDVDNACNIVSNSCIASCFVSKTLWHQRLGHLADQVLDVLKTTLNLDSYPTSDHLCDTCNKAKQTREPFPLTAWVYMLKGKDDVYDSIISFVQMFLNQFVINIKVFRSDNGTEIPSSVLSGKSPYFYVYGHVPSLSHLRDFGCYKLLSLENKSIFYSRDVKFYEIVFPFKMKNNVKQTEFESGVTKDLNHKDFFDNENPKRPNDERRVSSNNDGTELSPDINQGNDDSEATSMDETNNTHPKGIVSDETDFINDIYENSEFNSKTDELPVNTLRRSSRQTKLPSSLNDFVVEGKVKYGVEKVVNYANLNHDNYCFISALNKSVEPTCYEEAILIAIRNKWIYKIKYKSSGDIDRYKARLVVKGFNQKEGINFDETFSPVVKMSTVRCVIALSVTNKWPLFQLDINNVFLYGDLDEDIYMTIPKGFASKDNKNKVCKLVKSLYGLKQAPRK